MNANERSHQEAREAAATLTAYLTDQEDDLRRQASDAKAQDDWATADALETQAAAVWQARKRAEQIQDLMNKAGLPS